VGPTMDVMAAAAPGETSEHAAQYVHDLVVHPRLGEVLAAASRARRALRLPDVGAAAAVIVAPILVGDDVPAYLMTLERGEGGASEDVSLLLTEHAATICGVILGRERVVAAAASRIRDDLVEGLLSGRGRDPGEIGRWARHLGYDSERDHHVLSIALEVAKAERDDSRAALGQRVAGAAEQFFTTRAPDAIISVRDAEVVVVLPERDQRESPSRAARLGRMCVDRLGELFPEVISTIGIGGQCREPAEIPRSYGEARRTVETVRRMDRADRVVAFSDLGIHRLLLQVPDLSELQSFARDVLGKLSVHEREHSSEYLVTLGCYFRENSSPQRASRRLHVHPNTVTYRIRRVEEITGLDLDSYRDRLMAQVALEILDAVGDGL
jgi:sugar diacid utilization regulator